VLHELGCYVDLTFPSARILVSRQGQQIYLADRRPRTAPRVRARERARVGATTTTRVLMITGPLALAASAMA